MSHHPGPPSPAPDLHSPWHDAQLEPPSGESAEPTIARLRQELQLKNEQLQELSTARTRLLARVSHQLSQPTHAIGLWCERAFTQTNPLLLKHGLNELRELSVSLSDSLSTLMELTRLDAGWVQAHLAPAPLDPLLQRLEHEFAGPARQRGLELSVPSTGLWVRTDPVLLYGVLTRLVSNAIAYTPRGQVSIELQPDEGQLSIAVRDTGIGIRVEKLDMVFKDFVRLQNANETASEGLGLGLSIVKRYASLMEHPLSVSSVEQQGSCFGIRLPLAQNGEPPAAIRTPIDQRQPDPHSPPAPELDDAHLSGLRVLVVDNVDMVLVGMQKTLSAWGCQVFSATCLAQARGLAQRQALDLVISDLHLGDTEPNGLTLIHALRVMQGRTGSRSQALLPALLLTGDVSGQPEVQAQAAQVGMLFKPVRPSLLKKAIIDRLVAMEPLASMVQTEASDAGSIGHRPLTAKAL